MKLKNIILATVGATALVLGSSAFAATTTVNNTKDPIQPIVNGHSETIAKPNGGSSSLTLINLLMQCGSTLGNGGCPFSYIDTTTKTLVASGLIKAGPSAVLSTLVGVTATINGQAATIGTSYPLSAKNTIAISSI